MCVCAHMCLIVGFTWKPIVAKSVVGLSPLRLNFHGEKFEIELFQVISMFEDISFSFWSEKLILWIYLEMDSFYFLANLVVRSVFIF